MTTNTIYGNLAGRLRCSRVRDIPNLPGYEWVTESFLRHAIFNAEDRIGSGGAVIQGNGLSDAIIRVGRKVLIDLNAFDAWVESHRCSTNAGRVDQ
jgi:hypothetical protein